MKNVSFISLVDVRGKRQMARLLWADRKEAATHTTTRFNQGVQNSSVNSQHIET